MCSAPGAHTNSRPAATEGPASDQVPETERINSPVPGCLAAEPAAPVHRGDAVSRSAERKYPASPCIRHTQGLRPAEPSGASGFGEPPGDETVPGAVSAGEPAWWARCMGACDGDGRTPPQSAVPPDGPFPDTGRGAASRHC